MSEASYSKLVDGYKRAFIDSSVEAEPAYTPQFISNYRGNKVLTQLENELRECSSMFMSVAFITGGGIAHLKGVLKEMEPFVWNPTPDVRNILTSRLLSPANASSAAGSLKRR